jgi:hypothetical protein
MVSSTKPIVNQSHARQTIRLAHPGNALHTVQKNKAHAGSSGADDDLCYTVINPVVRQTWIRCNAVGGWYPTYFSYNRWTTRPFTTDVRPSVTATLTVTVDNPLSSTSINSNPTTTDGSAGPGPIVQESTSDFVSITSITSSQDPVAAAPTPTCGDFDPYCTRPPAEPAKLTSKGLAGAILGAVAGVAALALFFYLLFKLYRKRRQWQSHANEGTLPGPRNPSNENKRPGKVDTSNQLSSDPEDSSPSSYKRFLIAANHPSKATELSDLPSSKRQSVATVSTRTNEDLDTLSSTDTPLLPELLESPGETAVSELLKSGSLGVSNTATSDAPSKGDEHQRRNSKMSPLAGPYLTAEKGLSRGYWAADQDQLKADEAMEESSHKSERGGDSKDEAKA